MTPNPDLDSSDCRARLVQAATEMFVAEGYRVSVERVAMRAGVARQTLYNHFPRKADLFGEVVRQATAALLFTLGDDGQTLRDRLLRFGLAYRGKLLGAEGLGFFRAIIAETTRFPELVATFYRTGPVQTAARLRTILEAAMLRGELRRTNPEFATTTLLSMLVGADRIHYLFSGDPPPEPDPIHVAQIVDCYLRAFAPEYSPDVPTPAPCRSTP